MFSAEFNVASLLANDLHTRLVTFVNPVSFYGFKAMAGREEFNYVFSDGALLTRLHNLFFHQHKIARISFDFSSIAGDVLAYAAQQGLRVVMVGGSQEDTSAVSLVLAQRFAKLNFAVYPGFFASEDDRDNFIVQMNDYPPDIVVCGMGFPRQELFLLRCKALLKQPFVGFTCGGFISQTALRPDYYPAWVKRFGLRWLQRAILHSHVRQRLLVDYPAFLVKYLWDVLKKGEKVYQ
ncbi:WecB/TagA/CpsF family glycosyltransferase [Pseudaeromonas paramecii]|uniref:WecB/TagA/CpsF family glycosyltransferase n=1 Tax=Pseudaeromonas paramecii TaxID=2138166 RepID=A0ABP8Q164_9GAMM